MDFDMLPSLRAALGEQDAPTGPAEVEEAPDLPDEGETPLEADLVELVADYGGDAEAEIEAPPPMPVDVKIEIPYDQIVVAVEYDGDESEPTSLIELDGATLYLGKCEEVMATLPESSIDAIVCDPPYGLEFMGKEFDKLGDGPGQQAWHYRWAVEAFRVLKPGGHIIAFGGTRTYHRLAAAIEDAGFEVRDTFQWIYGSGFPKSMDVSKAIDKAAGHWRGRRGKVTGQSVAMSGPTFERVEKEDPVTPEAQQWEGWGTALKPAYEPAVLARKPIKGTVANNVLTHGTGALNIDASRVGWGGDRPSQDEWNRMGSSGSAGKDGRIGQMSEGQQAAYASGLIPVPEGRFPANVLLSHHEDCERVGERKVKHNGGSPTRKGREGGLYEDGLKERILVPRGDEDGTETIPSYDCHPDCPIRILDEQTSGEYGRPAYGNPETAKKNAGRELDPTEGVTSIPGNISGFSYSDKGGVSRFFQNFDGEVPIDTDPQVGFVYSAKASKSEREKGLVGRIPCPKCGELDSTEHQLEGQSKPQKCRRGVHPTVKPVKVMEYLIRLVTPPGGIVLDPFLGSGSTGVAAVNLGFEFAGIEMDPDYMAIAEARVTHAIKERE